MVDPAWMGIGTGALPDTAFGRRVRHWLRWGLVLLVLGAVALALLGCRGGVRAATLHSHDAQTPIEPGSIVAGRVFRVASLDGVHLREEPQPRAHLVVTVPRGDSVRVLHGGDLYCRVEPVGRPSLAGWVRKAELIEFVPLTDLHPAGR